VGSIQDTPHLRELEVEDWCILRNLDCTTPERECDVDSDGKTVDGASRRMERMRVFSLGERECEVAHGEV